MSPLPGVERPRVVFFGPGSGRLPGSTGRTAPVDASAGRCIVEPRFEHVFEFAEDL